MIKANFIEAGSQLALAVGSSQEAFKYKNDKRAEISIKYTADFLYWNNEKQRWIVEELKSSYTKKLADYSIRRRLFKYSIKDREDIEFIEIIY